MDLLHEEEEEEAVRPNFDFNDLKNINVQLPESVCLFKCHI